MPGYLSGPQEDCQSAVKNKLNVMYHKEGTAQNVKTGIFNIRYYGDINLATPASNSEED